MKCRDYQPFRTGHQIDPINLNILYPHPAQEGSTPPNYLRNHMPLSKRLVAQALNQS